MPGIRVEKLVLSMVISRFMRLATSVKRSIWNPSRPPPSFGMACGANVPSTPVRSGGSLVWAIAGPAKMSVASMVKARRRCIGILPGLDCGVPESIISGSPMAERILVINPNSTEAVTRGIDEAVEPLRMPGGPAIECVTLKAGPPGIETQQHVDGVVAPLLTLVREKESEYAAFVIACYSDPGLHSVREATKKPVLGISECGILTALTLGHRFGVIAILQQSIPRHLRYVGALGVTERFAGELPVGIPVVELSDEKKTFGRMVEVGKALRERHGADVVVMGCAGMARYRKPLQDEIGVPVVEPPQAAVAMAIGRVRLNWANS